jgi:hypothetical protein
MERAVSGVAGTIMSVKVPKPIPEIPLPKTTIVRKRERACMVGTEEAQFITETFGKPAPVARLKKKLRLLFTSRSGIIWMRNRLIAVYKQPFADRITIDSLDYEDAWTKRMFIDHFDERIKTLPDDIILDLYGDYVKAGAMRTESGRDAVNKYIVHFLELSYYRDGWFDKEKMGARSRKKKF